MRRISMVASEFLLLQVMYPSQSDKILLEHVFQIAFMRSRCIGSLTVRLDEN